MFLCSDDVKPLFASYSPVELLDHLLDQSSGSHQRLSSTLGSNVHKSVPGKLTGFLLSATFIDSDLFVTLRDVYHIVNDLYMKFTIFSLT